MWRLRGLGGGGRLGGRGSAVVEGRPCHSGFVAARRRTNAVLWSSDGEIDASQPSPAMGRHVAGREKLDLPDLPTLGLADARASTCEPGAQVPDRAPTNVPDPAKIRCKDLGPSVEPCCAGSQACHLELQEPEKDEVLLILQRLSTNNAVEVPTRTSSQLTRMFSESLSISMS